MLALIFGWNMGFSVRGKMDNVLIASYKQTLNECQTILTSLNSPSVIKPQDYMKRTKPKPRII